MYCVLQSPPYWQELPYNSETFDAGEVAYSISYGTSKGVGGEWGVGLGVHFSFGAVFGPEVLGKRGKEDSVLISIHWYPMSENVSIPRP